MNNQEQYDLIKKVCDQVRTALQKESDRLKNVAENWRYKNSAMYDKLYNDSLTMVSAKMCVNAVETGMEWELFKKATEDDNITI